VSQQVRRNLVPTA